MAFDFPRRVPQANGTVKLAAQNLGKKYSGVWVVHDVSLEVASGEIVGLLGPNGAGKTTSFYMMVGLVKADRGKVMLGERDLTNLPMHRRARLGISYLPQEVSIFRGLSAIDNLLAVIEMRKDIARRDRRATAMSLLQEFHVDHIADRLSIKLSGGERRRVEVARAVASNPAFILLDEPFAGVDPISVTDLKEIIRMLTKIGIGVLVTDHNVRETLSLCDRAYVVSKGSLIASGVPEEILQNQEVQDAYLGVQFRL